MTLLGASFRETLELKSDRDRMLGFGELPEEEKKDKKDVKEKKDALEIAVSTASRGLLTFRMDPLKIKKSHPEYVTMLTHQQFKGRSNFNPQYTHESLEIDN